MATVKLGRLSTTELVKLRQQIDRRIKEAMNALETQLEEMRSAIEAGGGNGSPRSGRRPGRPAASKGRKGQRQLRPTGLPYRALTVIKGSSGPIAVSDIRSKLKLPEKKAAQLGVTLGNLKKRGEIKSAGRGLYASA
jgi:hypothetical protein